MTSAAGASGLPLRMLALGDSYTIGESVPAAQRWPVQLAALLNGEGIPVAAPEIIAQTGWTTDELSVAISAAQPAGRYGLVTLLIGVNNQYRGRDPEEFSLQFKDLLQRSVEFAGHRPDRVLVLSIPDWGVTPFGQQSGRDRAQIANQIDHFNALARAQVRIAGALWVDITDLTREAPTNPALLAADGLHPSGKDYGRWAARALPLVRARLRPE